MEDNAIKVLVLGGCGFIGSHIVDRLLAQGCAVRVFDRQHERFRQPLRGVDYRIGNFGDRMAMFDALSDIDAVMHLVSTTFPGTADLDPKVDVEDNLIGSIALLDAMVRLSISRVLFLSSGGTVYGIPDTIPIPETHRLQPISSYGIVKVAIESYLAMYQRARGISPVIIRASNPYGPRQGHKGVQGVVTTFLSRLLSEEPIEIWGDGTVVRDYLQVADLADLCVRALFTDRTGPYNAGSGVGTSVNDIVDVLRSATGQTIVPVYKPGRGLDVPRSVLDISRAQESFDWAAQTDMQNGITETWKWMCRQAAV